MKTKSLLLTALLSVAGASGLMAQSSNVFSQNIVGYVSQSFPSGFSIVTCQLKGSPDNKLTTLIPNPPEGTIVYKWDNAQNRYFIDDFFLGSWEGDDLNLTLNPGEAAWVKAPSAFTNTIVGEVVLSSTNNVRNGFNIVGSVLPKSATLESLGYSPREGDIVYQWSNAQNRYYINDYFLGSWEGDNSGASPTLAVGEGAWIKNTSGSSNQWFQAINVGP